MTDDLKKLEQQLAKLKQTAVGKGREPSSSSKMSDLGIMTDVAAEIAAGVFVGVIIGLFFDNLVDSKPIFLIICIIVSIVSAFRSIWKKYTSNKAKSEIRK